MGDQMHLLYEALYEIGNELRTANKIAYIDQLNRHGSRNDELDMEVRKEIGLDKG